MLWTRSFAPGRVYCCRASPDHDPKSRPTKSRAGIVGLTRGEQKASEPGCVITLPRPHSAIRCRRCLDDTQRRSRAEMGLKVEGALSAYLWSGMRAWPLPRDPHKVHLYGSSKSTFAAGVFGPAPIPTLRLSLVDCEI